MSRILITGSAQGLGRNAATLLLEDGHQVVVHARSHQRAADLTDLIDHGPPSQPGRPSPYGAPGRETTAPSSRHTRRRPGAGLEARKD